MIDPLEDVDPNDLIDRAREGCQACYNELARRFFPRIVHLVLPRIVGCNHMDAEDIAQESLARAFLKLDAFDPRYRFSTWLYTIAIRIAADHNRGVRRRLTLLETHRSLLAVQVEAVNTSASDYDRRETVESIWQVARENLPEPYYTAMWLRFAEDLSVEEISRVMRKTKVGVRVLLHRARVKMLQKIELKNELELQKKSSHKFVGQQAEL